MCKGGERQTDSALTHAPCTHPCHSAAQGGQVQGAQGLGLEESGFRQSRDRRGAEFRFEMLCDPPPHLCPFLSSATTL